MKKILVPFLVLIGVLVVVVLVNTLRFQPQSFGRQVEPVSVSAHPEKLSEAIGFETIAHKREMIDREAFEGFHRFLEEKFPLMDAVLEKEVVNDFSLMYKWQGTDGQLQPLVLLAHQDVVPAEYSTLNRWDYPPFSGAITEEHIYGRGTIDDKGSLVAICEAVEHLLEQGFRPHRSIYLCFGHDEEIGGEEGAKAMAAKLSDQNIRAYMVLDEGGTLASGIVPGIDRPVALIGTTEKGYLSLEMLTVMEGGHSSMPEKRTALEVMNKALCRLQENPMPNRMSPPLQGFIEHIGPHMPFLQRMAFANPWLFKPLIFSEYEKSASGAAMLHTTQVTTIFQSGIKDNIVPTRARAVVNYRLLPGDAPEEVLERARRTVDDSAVRIKVHEDQAVAASPVSDHTSEQFEYLASVINSVSEDALVSPYLVLGATDARHFHSISDHVFRFSPIPLTQRDLSRIHGLNERISIEGYQKSVEFYAKLISNK